MNLKTLLILPLLIATTAFAQIPAGMKMNTKYLSLKSQMQRTSKLINQVSFQIRYEKKLGHNTYMDNQYLNYLRKNYSTLKTRLGRVPKYVRKTGYSRNTGTTHSSRSSIKGQVLLTRSAPSTKNMRFSYRGAKYDYQRKNHWRVGTNSYVKFEFYGKRSFGYRVLGTTIKGVPQCKINIYVNGRLIRSGMRISGNWQWKRVAKDYFTTGKNTVIIKSVGRSSLWIDLANIRD